MGERGPLLSQLAITGSGVCFRGTTRTGTICDRPTPGNVNVLMRASTSMQKRCATGTDRALTVTVSSKQLPRQSRQERQFHLGRLEAGRVHKLVANFY